MQDNINQRASSMINFMDEIDKASKARQASERFQNSEHMKRRILDTKKSEAKGICLDLIFNKIYKDALPMNDEYKIAHGTELDDEFRDFINVKAPDGLECYLHESMKKGNNVAKTLIESVNKLVRDYYFEDSMNLGEVNVNELDFDPNDETVRNKLDGITDKMGTEEISEIIKQNVKQAALSDIQNAKNHEEEMKNLVDELKNDPSITSEAAIDRRLAIAGLKNHEFYQPSLFEGIMVNKLNLIKESAEEVSPEDANKKAFFEATKEMTKLSLLNAMKLEDVFHNQKKIARDYATMKVESSKVNFQEGVDEVLREQRKDLFAEGGYISEGANMDVLADYKAKTAHFKLCMDNAKKLMKKKKYTEAAEKIDDARKDLHDCYNGIDNVTADSVGSILFGFFTGWLPVCGRIIVATVVGQEFGNSIMRLAVFIKRIKVIMDDCEKNVKNIKLADFNMFTNAIKIKLREYEKELDKLSRSCRRQEKEYNLQQHVKTVKKEIRRGEY